ncbi:MAG: SCO family protein [Sulfuricaulis sp.]
MMLKRLKTIHLRRGLAMASLALFAILAACSQPKHWALQDIKGLIPQLKFNLTDDAGQNVSAANYRGKIVLLYFGYTHCPDVCPTTLGTLALTLHNLGADADKVRVLFVSVDPKRDTTAVLKQYVNAFGPQFVGLRGSDDEMEGLAKRYRVAYSRDKPDSQGNYTVTHSSAVFIFDGEGKSRLLSLSSSKAGDIAHDLKLLLASN